LKLELRHLRADEDDYELIFGLLFVPLLAVAALVVSRIPGNRLPPCWLNRLTDIPCPTCGAYRALTLGCRGRVVEAWLMQPLGVTVVGLAAAYCVYSAITTVGRFRRLRLRFEGRRDRFLAAGAVVLAVAVNWGYLVAVGR